jgi:hypothetical protein
MQPKVPMANKIFGLFMLILFGFTLQGQTGIGTQTPATKLHIKSNGPILRLEGSDHAYLELFPQGASTRYAYLGYPSAYSTSLTFMNHYSTGPIVFGTNSGNKMWLNSDGKLGIGTSSPTTIFHIENGNTFGDPASTSSPSIYVFNTNNASSLAHSSINVRTAGLNGGKPFYSLDIASNFGYSMGINNPSDQFIINSTWNFDLSNAGNNALIINQTGQSRVQIPTDGGNIASGWPAGWGGGLNTFDINCAGIYYTTLAARSDRRLKNTIVGLDSSNISKVLQLRPVSYFWNDQGDNHHKQYGFIAQEIEELFPDMVSTASDSMQTKSVNYQALHALSISVIQAQQKEIDALKQKQIELENRLILIESKFR